MLLLKGDVPGHEFHGNQYTRVALAALHEQTGNPPITHVGPDELETAHGYGTGGVYDPSDHSIKVPHGASPHVVAHELGHALDQRTSGSSDSEFSRAYRADMKALKGWDRRDFEQNPHVNSRAEAFAELTAYLHTGRGSMFRGSRLRAAFPKTLAHMRSKMPWLKGKGDDGPPILKGDVPGHEFHGNQWSSGHSFGHAKGLAEADRMAKSKFADDRSGQRMANHANDWQEQASFLLSKRRSWPKGERHHGHAVGFAQGIADGLKMHAMRRAYPPRKRRKGDDGPPVLKGDSPGHAFRGNQYRAGHVAGQVAGYQQGKAEVKDERTAPRGWEDRNAFKPLEHEKVALRIADLPKRAAGLMKKARQIELHGHRDTGKDRRYRDHAHRGYTVGHLRGRARAYLDAHREITTRDARAAAQWRDTPKPASKPAPMWPPWMKRKPRRKMLYPWLAVKVFHEARRAM